ncbi:MAG: hypothetical protein Q8M73_06275 [Actinomycetota bacterium]|nr:hypothetical protein [Actinomycetota bacterium]
MSEGVGPDPLWGIATRVQSESEIAETSSPVFAIPTANGLRLRSEADGKTEWERWYRWNQVRVEEFQAEIRLSGPFGTLVCEEDPQLSNEEVLARIVYERDLLAKRP